MMPGEFFGFFDRQLRQEEICLEYLKQEKGRGENQGRSLIEGSPL